MSFAPPNHPLNIRLAMPQDVPLMLSLIHALAEFEREPNAVVATATDLHRDGFGPVPRFHCLIAEWLGQPAGFALYFRNYSTWRGHHGIHLEDLFVLPEFRNRGVGKMLLSRVAATAVVEGCARLEWNVLDWNTVAIDFYNNMGAEMSTDWRIMRISGDALCALSERCD